MRVCMLAYTFYESDSRVIYYAEELAKRGDHVDVIALRKDGQMAYEVLSGVHVYRIQKRKTNEKSSLSYLFKILIFLLKSCYFVAKKHVIKPYDLIHVHSVPDFEVFAAIIPKFSGAKIILDIHDIVPEFYAVKFNKTEDSILFKSLVVAERLSIAFSDHVIIANDIWKEKLLNRSVQTKKCTAILNYPSKIWTKNLKKVRDDGKFIIIYPGSLNWHQGLDIAINALALIRDKAPEIEFHIYGDGPEKKELIKQVERLKLQERVIFQDEVPISFVPEIMANADLGIIPKRNDKFGGEAFSTKSLEFMSVGVPIIVARTKIDSYYFNDNIVKFFEPGNEKDLADAMFEMIKNKKLREQLAKNASEFVKKYSWEANKHIYLNLVDSLVGKEGRTKDIVL